MRYTISYVMAVLLKKRYVDGNIDTLVRRNIRVTLDLLRVDKKLKTSFAVSVRLLNGIMLTLIAVLEIALLQQMRTIRGYLVRINFIKRWMRLILNVQA